MSFAEGEAGHQGGGQLEGGHQDWDEKAFDMEELPPTVSCSPAIVSVLHGEAGVAATGDGDVSAGGGTRCGFLTHNFCVIVRKQQKGTHTGRRNKYSLTRISFLALDIMALICSAVMGAPPPGAALAIGVVS